jgi:predicted MFS family arabinose efflux permease
VSLLLMSETLGLLAGSAVGGWLYQHVAAAGPFVFEAACMVAAAAAVGRRVPAASAEPRATPAAPGPDRRRLRGVMHTPGVLLMGVTSAALAAVQTGTLVFLFPLYLAERGGLRPEVVGYLVGLGVLGRLIALWITGRVSDRWHRLRLLAAGLVAQGVLLGSLTVLTDPALLSIWSLSIGAAAGLVAGLPTAIVGDRVAPGLSGIAIGWLRTVTDAGMLFGPLVTGALADAIDLGAPFRLAALVLGALAWWCHRAAAAGAGSRPPA